MRLTKIVLAMAVALGCGPLAAATDGWEFEVTPYVWAIGMDGTAGLRGVTADVDMSFSDVWDKLDAAFLGLITAQNGPWSLAFEGIYLRLQDDGSATLTGPEGKVSISKAYDVTVSTTILQGSVGYRVLDGESQLDLVGGLRYNHLDADLDVAVAAIPEIGFPGGAKSASGSEDWVDGVVGARILRPIGRGWALLGYADIGAGGADLTYQWMAGANWAITDRLTAKGGYRQIYWDYEKDGTVFDMRVGGVYLGLGIGF